MAITIFKNESNASLRCVPMFCVKSDGTSAATNESGNSFAFSLGGVFYPSGGSLSAVSAPLGLYDAVFAASRLSLIGAGSVIYSSGTAIPTSAPFQVLSNHEFASSGKTLVNGTSTSDFTLASTETSVAGALLGSFMVLEYADGTRVGRFLSSVTCSTGTVVATADYPFPAIPAAGLGYTLYPQTPNVWSQLTGTSAATILGVTRLDSAVTLKAVTHSGATIDGVNRVNSSVTPANATYSGVTVRIEGVDYSGLTIKGISNYANISSVTLNAGTHSGATIQGLSNYANISNVTLAAGTHSGVTIQGVSNYANISNVTLAAGIHSGATVQGVTRLNSNVTLNANTHSGATVQGILDYTNISNVTLAAGTHSGVTIDGVKFVGTAGERSIASSLLSSDMGASRLVQQALFALRNKVEGVIPGSSILTVYKTDDTTSDWTATPSFNTFGGLSSFDPR